MTKKYTRKEISEIVGIPDRRVEFYTNQGVLSEGFWKVGRGIPRKYSQINIVELFIVKKLSANGVDLAMSKIILHKLVDYATFRRLFGYSGDIDIKKIAPIVQGLHKLFLVLYDRGASVRLLQEGTKHFQESKGNLLLFSMQNHDSALVVDLTDEIKTINNL